MQYISDILDAPEPEFSLRLRDLERGAGHPKVDINLGLEIKNKVRSKMRELGLDPKDTTSDELYHGLMSLAKLHDKFLRDNLKGADITDANELLPLIKKYAESVGLPGIWGLKHSVAKRLLKKTPPKHLMKSLGYRSIDSMLKREQIAEVYAAIRFVESPAWLQKFILNYKHLAPSDFEIRPLEIVVLNKKKWQALAEEYVKKSHHNIVHIKEMGVILLLPLPGNKLDGLALITLPLVLHYINEMRLYSTMFKFNQVKPDFGDILVRTLLLDLPNAAKLAGQPLHWRVIQSHFGKRAEHAAVFEPHVQAEDLLWQRAEDVLFKLEPALMFWRGTDYVALPGDHIPVSFNLLDAAVNYYNNLPPSNQSVGHMRASLGDEISRRYLAIPSYEQHVIRQLDSQRGMVE